MSVSEWQPANVESEPYNRAMASEALNKNLNFSQVVFVMCPAKGTRLKPLPTTKAT